MLSQAAELVKANVDVIISAGDPNVRAAQQATKIIPILAIAEDLVGSGFVTREGGLEFGEKSNDPSP